MRERKGAAETRKLLRILLTIYHRRLALAEASNYSTNYLSYLCRGRRIASRPFCNWVISAHPELKELCNAIQISRLTE
jgi:hypothetical protein